MSIEPPPTPLAPVIRFRIHTALIATTVLAIAAAVAAPYWRKQTPSAQTALLAYWAVVLLCGTLGGWMQWRQAWQLPPNSGEVRHVGWAAKRRRWAASSSALLGLLACVGSIVLIGSQSRAIADSAKSTILAAVPLGSSAIGIAHGMILGGGLLYFMRRPLYFCEYGAYGWTGAHWKYIRHAEWIADRPGIMKLHRLDGDIYVDVPAREREAVEAFVRTKTNFIDAATTPEPQPTS